MRGILKELEEETDKVLNEATAKKKRRKLKEDDNFEDIQIKILRKRRKLKDSSSKTKSVDILSINKYIKRISAIM
ncbi:hypothetical protein Glove_232g118 [Diversispora epigaea]|uniref:Uncharacterized protein n=1 Tax=Diversispora epigaea TaxID=1348612 RepID=A0A397IEQ4_9GLOM|nr:hypothetical protein Glove_232g118 [Diversispora epigaea]